MGNGTKIGLVLVLVLVVVVIANLLDNEVDKGKNGVDQAPKLDGRDDPARGRTESATPTGARGTTGDRRESSTPSYESGRERRLAGNESRTGAGAPTGGNSPPSVIGDRSVASDPSGLRESPTGVGRPAPLDATAAPPRTAAGSEGEIRHATAQDPSATGTPSVTGDTSSGRVDIVGRDPSESGTPVRPASDLSRSLGAAPPPAGAAPATPPGGSATPAATPRGSEASTPAAGREGATREVAGFPREHVVADGENLWKIAEKYYQKGELFTHILQGNPSLGSGEEIRIGQKIKIPAPPASALPKSGVAASTAAGAPAGAKPPAPTASSSTPPVVKPGFKAYTIQDGDTLFDIAEDRLGNGNRWTEIQAANPGLDPGKLRVGVTIQIPGA